MSKETRDKLRAMPLEELKRKRDSLRETIAALWFFSDLNLSLLDEYDDVVAILTIRSLDEEEIDL